MKPIRNRLLSTTTMSLALGAAVALAGGGITSSGTIDLAGSAYAACNPCAAKNPCNPCAAKNPCNPCAATKIVNPCNPCAAKNPCNPCAATKIVNPCNPCAAANPCNPCQPKN